MSDEISESKSGWLKKLSTLLGEGDQPRDPHTDFLSLLTVYRNKHHDLNDDTAKMMDALLDLGKNQVRDIMIPRGQMTVIQEDWSFERVMSVILESGHSRYPVVDEDQNQVKGVLITKDLFPLLFSNEDERSFLDVLRPATLVPESKALDAMLREFKMNRMHIAIVIDEYGSLSGLVTIEDVIEEIVGEIDDEHDKIPEAEVREISEGIYQVNALMSIEAFNEQFGTTLSDLSADTVGGYFLQKFGKMPVVGDGLEIGKTWQITVSKANQRRILSLKLTKL